MVCIEKRPHKMRGRSLAPNFIYLTCLLDREHIILSATAPFFLPSSTLPQKVTIFAVMNVLKGEYNGFIIYLCLIKSMQFARKIAGMNL